MRRSKLKNSNAFHRRLKNRERSRYWLAIFVWVFLIYFMAVLAVPASNLIAHFIAIKFLMILFFALITFSFIIVVFWKAGIQNTQTFLLTLSTLVIFAFQYFTAPFPAKQYHQIEYSVLAFLICSAVQLDQGGRRPWIIAFIGTALVGAGDEILQLFVPGRFSTFHDFLLDLASSMYGLMIASIVQIEKRLSLLDLRKNRKRNRLPAT